MFEDWNSKASGIEWFTQAKKVFRFEIELRYYLNWKGKILFHIARSILVYFTIIFIKIIKKYIKMIIICLQK